MKMPFLFDKHKYIILTQTETEMISYKKEESPKRNGQSSNKTYQTCTTMEYEKLLRILAWKAQFMEAVSSITDLEEAQDKYLDITW